MRRKVCPWLASYLPSHPQWPEMMLKSEQAAGFLLVWPLYEKELFNGFLRGNQIEEYAKQYTQHYAELDVDDIVRAFHNRYQGRETWRNMGFENAELVHVLSKPFDELTNHEKLHFIMHVVFRYRNNIFHGNKRIDEWDRYETEINYCLQFMMALMEFTKESKNQ